MVAKNKYTRYERVVFLQKKKNILYILTENKIQLANSP